LHLRRRFSCRGSGVFDPPPDVLAVPWGYLGGVVLLTLGALAALETDTVRSFGAGVWWALSLVTTVGFVGGTPTTTAGRVIAALLMVFGFALLALTTAAIASLFVREDESPVERREAALEAQAIAELRALHERLDRLERAWSADAEHPVER
jgi:voltage-gated potassium channel